MPSESSDFHKILSPSGSTKMCCWLHSRMYNALVQDIKAYHKVSKKWKWAELETYKEIRKAGINCNEVNQPRAHPGPEIV